MTAPKSVRWKAVVYAGRDASGRQRQRTRTGHAPNLQAARKAEEAARVELRAEIAETAKWKGTVKQLADEWVEHKRRTKAATTIYAEQIMIRRIIAGIGRIRLEKLTAKDLDGFYNRLLDGDKSHKPLSASTVNHYHRILHAMLRQAHKWGSVPGNVADLASPPHRQWAGRHTGPTPEALVALIAAAPPSLMMAAALAAATGCRRGEIVALVWSDIDGNQLHVWRSLVDVPGVAMHLKSPKSGRDRIMTLDADVLALLAVHRSRMAAAAVGLGGELVRDGPIFADLVADPSGGTPMRPGWVTQAWRRLCDRHGMKIRFHDLRHWHATQLNAAGIDPKTVSERLGHSLVSTTMNMYTDALKAGDDHAALTIGAILRGGT